eukprot:COSAG02_NODE_557_length_20379_cov_6.688215_11_plen_80_part_00
MRMSGNIGCENQNELYLQIIISIINNGNADQIVGSAAPCMRMRARALSRGGGAGAARVCARRCTTARAAAGRDVVFCAS